MSYLVEQGGKEKCWKWSRPHEKKYCTLIHHMPKPLTLTPTSHVPNCNAYRHEVDHCFTLHPKLQEGQSQNTNANKGYSSRKVQPIR
jgi:hypothetical protein